jgi:hypothetical protein
MLTKEERSAIAERIKSVGYVDEKTFYESIVGKCVPSTTSYTEDLKTIFRVVLDLCDTSNMIGLPLDKDGIPFKRGDTVYESDGTEHIVDGYAFSRANAKIVSVVDLINNTRILFEADEITHKKPVTIASLAKELADIVASDYGTPMVVKHKISEIADQLEKLGDDNAN